jgi:glycosyltransferase involved in cell wall biosynthesis
VLGLASRIVEQKGIIYLLQALVPLAQRYPKLHVLIAGEGDLEESLKAAARELGVEDRAHFLGLRRDTAELFKTMDVFMLPSVWEGLPMAVLEAMAAGLPVIATQVGGLAAAVHDKINGCLISPSDAGAIATAVDWMLSEPARLRAYGAASRRIFEDRFSATAMAHAYATLYRGGKS